MLSKELNEKPIKIFDLIKQLNKDFDVIQVRIIWKHKHKDGTEEWCDDFAGQFKIENNKIISLDGDTYSDDIDVWQWEEFENKEYGVNHGLDIYVYDF